MSRFRRSDSKSHRTLQFEGGARSSLPQALTPEPGQHRSPSAPSAHLSRRAEVSGEPAEACYEEKRRRAGTRAGRPSAANSAISRLRNGGVDQEGPGDRGRKHAGAPSFGLPVRLAPRSGASLTPSRSTAIPCTRACVPGATYFGVEFVLILTPVLHRGQRYGLHSSTDLSSHARHPVAELVPRTHCLP